MGSSSGLIIAFVVVLWAAFFFPLVLRRFDEASKNASVETAGSLSRVISRPKKTELAVEQPVAADAPPKAERVAPKPARTPDRPAARLAAKRRRRTLLTLLFVTAVVGGVAGFGVIAPYWVAAPVALVVAWLVACRVQVRSERGIVRTTATRSKRSFPKVKLSRVKLPAVKLARVKLSKVKLPTAARIGSPAAAADVEEDTIVVSGQFEDIDPGRKHEMEIVALEADALDDKIVIAVPSISTAGEALWDPLPVTLPTYVTKPRAGRTVRTIDFSQPNTWTSGHIEGEDTELPRRANQRDDDSGDERRAVGH